MGRLRFQKAYARTGQAIGDVRIALESVGPRIRKRAEFALLLRANPAHGNSAPLQLFGSRLADNKWNAANSLNAGDGTPGLDAGWRHGRLIPLVAIAPDHDRADTGSDARRRAELPVIGARRHALCPLLRRSRRYSRNRDRHDCDG